MASAPPSSAHVYVFDLAGVLCGFYPDRRLTALSDASGLPPVQVRERIYDSGFIDRADRGELSLEAEFRQGASLLGLECDFATYRALWCTAFEPNQEMIQMVQSLRSSFRTALLTNNGPVVLDALAHELGSIGQVIDHAFVSGQFGATKPSGVVYDGVAEALGVPSSALTLIDDSAANVDGARRAGWAGILFVSSAQLRTELAIAP